MSYASHNSNSNSKPPIPAHFQAPLPIPATQPKEYNPTYVAPSPLFMTGVPGTFGAGWDGNGPGSFNVNGGAQAHHQGGGQQQQQPGFPSYETAKQIATLQSRLDRKLGPEYVSQRAGPGGSKLTYIEGWKVINVANEVFGFNGWSSTVQRLETDFCDTNPTTGRVAVGISAIIRITLRDGTVHEDVGYGEISNSPSKAAAFDKCKKEAITDAVKRALRSFGNVLGNCLYDKEYTKEINKMKTPTPRWDPKQLYRRPEFDEFGSRDGITTDPANGHNPQLAHAGPSSHASSSTSSATPAPPISRPTSYNTTPTTNTTNKNLARSAMNNSYNQNSVSSSTSANKVNGGGGGAGRPINNNPPTPVSLPRSNPAPPPTEATTLEECVPMGPTASQQMEMEFDDGFDLTGVVLDADAYSSGAGGGASSAGRRASGSEDVGDDSFAHISVVGNGSNSRSAMSAPPPPPPKQTTTPTADAPRSSKSSSPADLRSSTIGSSGNSNSNNNSNSSSSTSMKPPQQVPSASRPPPRVGGFNFPTGHNTTPSAAAPTSNPPPFEALKRNHSVAAAGSSSTTSGNGNTKLATRVYPPNAGAAKRAQSLAGLTSLESASIVPASVLPVVTRQPLGELPLFDDEGGDGGPAKRARVEYGGF